MQTFRNCLFLWRLWACVSSQTFIETTIPLCTPSCFAKRSNSGLSGTLLYLVMRAGFAFMQVRAIYMYSHDLEINIFQCSLISVIVFFICMTEYRPVLTPTNDIECINILLFILKPVYILICTSSYITCTLNLEQIETYSKSCNFIFCQFILEIKKILRKI